MPGTGFNIYYNTLTPGMAAFPAKFNAGMAAVTEYHAGQCEGYMKSNAPWTDRTGNARNGLFATPEIGTTYAIVLGHSVPYGIYLETRWSGRYAIILPTIQAQGPEFMSLAKEVLGRMG